MANVLATFHFWLMLEHPLYFLWILLDMTCLSWSSCHVGPAGSASAEDGCLRSAQGSLGLPWRLIRKESTYNAGDAGSIPGLGRCPGEGHGNPLQGSCQENHMDRGAWRTTVCEVAKSWTQMKQLNTRIQAHKAPWSQWLTCYRTQA